MSISTITVGGIAPALRILGADQLFNFSQPNSSFQLNNSFVPTALIPSTTRLEFNNNLYCGFRWTQQTTNTDNHGSLTLQSFVNASSSGTDLMSFTNSGNIIIEVATSMSADLDLNNNNITDLADPINLQDGATKNFVVNEIAAIPLSITLTGAVTGTGSTGGSITTMLTPITVSQITNFTSSVLAFTLNQFAIPTANINLNNYNITDSLDPVNPQDLATKNYVDTKASANIYMSGNTTDTNITATVFTKVLGTTTANHLQYFTSPVSNNLVFKGDAANAYLSSTLSVQHDFIGGTELSFAFYLNGSVISPTINNYCVLPNVAVNITASAFTELIIDDEIELWATAADNCKIIVTDANISIIT